MHHTEYFRGLFMVTLALVFHVRCLIPLQCFFMFVHVLSQSLRHVPSTRIVQCEGRGYFHFSSLCFIFQTVAMVVI